MLRRVLSKKLTEVSEALTASIIKAQKRKNKEMGTRTESRYPASSITGARLYIY
jgi:hypothetical protein